MNLPGQSKTTTPSHSKPKPGQSFGAGFAQVEYPPVGENRAVCVERNFDWLPDYETKELKPNIILNFEIEATREDGKRFIIENRYSAMINPDSKKAKLNKHLKGWSGSAQPLSKDQFQEWLDYINGDSDFANDVIDPNPPIVGANCILVLAFNEAGTFVNCDNILPPKVDADGEVINKLTVSEGYKPYAERKAEREERKANKENGGNSNRSAQGQSKSRVPF